ncbi:MAG TPA: polysaccharide biosynthesis/export family protein, partial [Planctomycetaceae bacterium]|nr:polysaccharide biosynthesis/export family protein [Planctomycetaceae bacterium]
RPSWRRLFVTWLWLASSVVFSGCASTDVIQADKLPQWLQAPTIENPKTLDLSRLATGSYSNDTIDRGDVLEVTINAGLNSKDNVTIPVRVTDNGMASLPVVGEVPVQGLELESAEAAIATTCVQRGIYRSPHVTVAMKRQRTNRVMLVGSFKNPGIQHLPRASSDLLSAIVAGGGLADDAGTIVEIRNSSGTGGSALPDRIASGLDASSNIAQTGHSQSLPTAAGSPQSFRVDLVSATKEGTSAYPLGDGAIVMVERRDPLPVNVQGLVHKPGPVNYPLGTELHLLEAVGMAGGTNNQGANKVTIIRHVAGQPNPTVIATSLREAKRRGEMNLKLAPGDVVSVEQTPATVFIDTIHLIRFAIGTSLTPLL